MYFITDIFVMYWYTRNDTIAYIRQFQSFLKSKWNYLIRNKENNYDFSQS